MWKERQLFSPPFISKIDYFYFIFDYYYFFFSNLVRKWAKMKDKDFLKLAKVHKKVCCPWDGGEEKGKGEGKWKEKEKEKKEK